MIKKALTPDKALIRLESLCASSEQCTGEAYKKLATWGVPLQQARSIVESLVRRKYIDDSRFCTAFVNDKFRFARWGKRKIYAAMSAKKISRPLIEKALSAIDEDEYYNTALSVLYSKIKAGADISTFEGRTKLFRFGVSRGFEPDVISNAIHQIMSIESP